MSVLHRIAEIHDIIHNIVPYVVHSMIDVVTRDDA